jgi:hypothetical protein
MALNAKERAQYLDALRSHGEEAYLAGLDMLQRVDSGKSLPKPKVAKGAKPHPAAAQLDELTAGPKKFPWKHTLCVAKCALTNIPTKDPAGFAACVLQCMTGGAGGGTGGGGSK